MSAILRLSRPSTTRILAAVLVALTTLDLRSAPAQDRPPSNSNQSQISQAVKKSLQRHKVPGASVAVINDYRLDWSQGYGIAAHDSHVTPTTLFQAASVSKPVTAAAALQLVERGKLKLDKDVNEQLKSWKIPANEFAPEHPVTLRLLLSHRAGLNVHGFGGYTRGSEIPTLLQVLNGHPPANSPAIRVKTQPGSTFRYSGGGYCVVQLLLAETARMPFPQVMHKHVLEPLEMTHSSYQHPLPEPLARQAAFGHDAMGRAIAGGFHIYPEMAAAGLWTTSADLALFVIDLEKCHAGRQGKLFSRATAEQMLTRQGSDCGLGLFLAGQGNRLRFTHNGVNAGFRSLLIGCPSTGQGVVVMTNGDNGEGVEKDVSGLVERLYDWPTLKP